MLVISCPMSVPQVLMNQGLGNGTQGYDYPHDDGGQRLTKPVDMLHTPQSPVMTTFHCQHEQTTVPA